MTRLICASIPFFLMFAGSAALAEGKRICVKKFAMQGFDPCKSQPGQFVYVVPEEGTGDLLCTRVYPDERCKQNKVEFTHALGGSRKPVCVLNFNQSVGNYCAAQPKEYAYARDPWG